MSTEDIVDHLPLKFMKWWTENVGALEIGKDYVDINTGMKSQLHLKYEGGKYFAHMRYNTVNHVETFYDLYQSVRDCEHGRGFMSGNIVEFYQDGFPDELSWEKFE
jgi:hypothetical protein